MRHQRPDATGVVKFLDQSGQPGEYAIGAHATKDDEATLRAHFDKWHGHRGWTFVSGTIVPDPPVRYTWEPDTSELATLLSDEATVWDGHRWNGEPAVILKLTARAALVMLANGDELTFTRRKWGQYALKGTTVASNAVLLRFEYREDR